jgi:hypothetical protein
MEQYFILTNRKRVIIALIHSVFFLLVACAGFLPPLRPAAELTPGRERFAASVAILAVYVVVSAILLWLTAMSRCWRERLYFALCSTSAVAGFGRIYLGDAMFPATRAIRVIMLFAAMLVGYTMLRAHSEEARVAVD